MSKREEEVKRLRAAADSERKWADCCGMVEFSGRVAAADALRREAAHLESLAPSDFPLTVKRGCRMPVRVGELVVEGDITDVGFIVDPKVAPHVASDYEKEMIIDIYLVNYWVRKEFVE